MFLAHHQSFSSSRQHIPSWKFPCSILCFGFILHWIKAALTWVLSLSLSLENPAASWTDRGKRKYMWKYVEIIWSNMTTIWSEKRKAWQKMPMVLLTKDTPFVSISSQHQALVQQRLAGNWPPCSTFRAHADHLTRESLQSLWYTSGRNQSF